MLEGAPGRLRGHTSSRREERKDGGRIGAVEDGRRRAEGGQGEKVCVWWEEAGQSKGQVRMEENDKK